MKKLLSLFIPSRFGLWTSSRRAQKYYDNACAYEKAKNHSEAAKWYRKAAEQGHEQAQDALENHYGNCENVPQDYIETTKWWRDQLDGTKH